MTELACIEKDRLTELEGVISRGLETFYEVGRALAEIRDSRLYRETHGDFESYTRERWQMAARTAHQTIKSAQAVELLGDCELPASESVARVLSSLPKDDVRKVWLEAIANDPQMTAEKLRKFITRANHDKQPLAPVSVSCPHCAHRFIPHKPETASRGHRNPSKGVIWASGVLSSLCSSVVDYGCGRFRNADVLEQHFARVQYLDTSEQVERLKPITGERVLLPEGSAVEADAALLIAVLHILPAHERSRVAALIEAIGARFIVVEWPVYQTFYKKRDTLRQREQSHYTLLNGVEVDALFPAYKQWQSKRITNNECRIYARN